MTLHGEGGAVRIRPLSETMLQIRSVHEGSFPTPFSYGVIKSEDEWPGAAMDIRESASALEFSVGDLSIKLDCANGNLAFSYRGQQLFSTTTGAAAYQPETGEVLWGAFFDKGTAFYGLGERTGPLNQAGRRAELWNCDPAGYDRDTDPIYMNIPFLIALSGGQAVGLFFDNSHRTWLDMGATTPGTLEYRAQGGEFRLYVMVGSPQEVLQQYTELTGRISLPPLWAFGFQQARWSYYPQARVMEIAQEVRKRRLPCVVIHLDIHYMNDYRCFTWHRQSFPDPQGMLASLHQNGFKVVTIIDPGIKVDRNYWVYREGIKHNAFVKYPDGTRFVGPVWPGDCHLPDFTDAAVRSRWGELYRD
jgi:alpha-glucosidase